MYIIDRNRETKTFAGMIWEKNIIDNDVVIDETYTENWYMVSVESDGFSYTPNE